MTEQAPETVELQDPGPPLVLTMRTTSKGDSTVDYTVSHEDAVIILRALADSIEAAHSE
jgi:hypothetical protein